MSTYTTSLKIQEIASGDQSSVWGATTNTNWTLIEQAVAGVQTITMGNANYTLTNLNGVSDEARNMVLVVTGTNSGIYQVIIPANQPKMYVIYNNTTGGYAITIGTTGVGGTLISVPNGVTAQVYTDGTNTYSAQTGSAGNFNVNGTLTASGITDTGALSAASLSVSGATTLSGTATAPTVSSSDNSTNIATTAFVQSKVGTLGTMATQNANNVAITGGTITGSYGLTAANATNATNATTAVNVSGTVAAANGGTGLTSVGATGNVLTSNGTTWTSTTPASTQPGTSITVYWVGGSQVTAGRAGNTVYQNTSGKTRFVLFAYTNNSGNVYVDNVNGSTTAITYNQAGGGAPWNTTFFLVPNGYYYQVPAGGSYYGWTEWE